MKQSKDLIVPEVKLDDIIQFDGVDDYREKFSTYCYNSVPVPRVSNILEETIAKPYLMIWAAKLGPQKFAIEKKNALSVGTFVHEMIENYLTTKTHKNINDMMVPNYLKTSVNTSYDNFIRWHNQLERNGYSIDSITAIELPLVCPYYGGTCDCIMVINGATYLVDFKTSKKISYEYIIQTIAYVWLINNGFCPTVKHIDGIGIIRAGKSRPGDFNDLFLNSFIPEQAEMIRQYIIGFFSMLASYYNNINMRYLYNQYTKVYDFDRTVLKEIEQ